MIMKGVELGFQLGIVLLEFPFEFLAFKFLPFEYL